MKIYKKSRILFEFVILNACTMSQICERKVIQRKIKCCGLVSKNVTIGYCAGYCIGASLLRAKPGNSAQVCRPFVEKSWEGKWTTVIWKKHRSLLKRRLLQYYGLLLSRCTRIVALCDTEIISWIFLVAFVNQLVKM